MFILFMSMHACLEVVWDVWFLMVWILGHKMSMICGIWLLESFSWLHSKHLSCVVNLRSSACNLTCHLFPYFTVGFATLVLQNCGQAQISSHYLFLYCLLALSGCINSTFRVIKCLWPSTLAVLQIFYHQLVGSTKIYCLLVVLNSALVFCELCSNGKPQAETW